MEKNHYKKKALFKYILKKYLEEIRALIKVNQSQSQEILIEKLSYLIREWWSFFNSPPPFFSSFVSRPFLPFRLPVASLKSYACFLFFYSSYFPLLKNGEVRFLLKQSKRQPWFSGFETPLFLLPKSASSFPQRGFYCCFNRNPFLLRKESEATPLVLLRKSEAQEGRSQVEASFTRLFLEPAIFLGGSPFFLDLQKQARIKTRALPYFYNPAIIGPKKNTGSLYPFFLGFGLLSFFSSKARKKRSKSLTKGAIKVRVASKKKEEKNWSEVLVVPPLFSTKLKWRNALYVLPPGLLFFSFLSFSPQISPGYKKLLRPFLGLKKSFLRKNLFQKAPSRFFFFSKKQSFLEKKEKQSFLEKKKKRSPSVSLLFKVKNLLFFSRCISPSFFRNKPFFFFCKRMLFSSLRSKKGVTTSPFLLRKDAEHKQLLLTNKKERGPIETFGGLGVSLSSFYFFAKQKNIEHTVSQLKKKKSNDKMQDLSSLFIRGESLLSFEVASEALALLRSCVRSATPFGEKKQPKRLLLPLRQKRKKGDKAESNPLPRSCFGTHFCRNQRGKRFAIKNKQGKNKKGNGNSNIKISRNDFLLSLTKKKDYSDSILLKILWKWTYRRHSKKSNKWLIKEYFVKINGQNRVFATLLPLKKNKEKTIKRLACSKKKAFLTFQYLFYPKWKKGKGLGQQEISVSTSDRNKKKSIIKGKRPNKSFGFKGTLYPCSLLRSCVRSATPKGLLRSPCVRSARKGRSNSKTSIRERPVEKRLTLNSYLFRNPLPFFFFSKKKGFYPFSFFEKAIKKKETVFKNKLLINENKKNSFFSRKKRKIIGTGNGREREVKDKQLGKRAKKSPFQYFNNSKPFFLRNTPFKIKKKTLALLTQPKGVSIGALACFFTSPGFKKPKTGRSKKTKQPKLNIFFSVPTSSEIVITHYKKVRKKFSKKKICDQSNDLLYWSYRKSKTTIIPLKKSVF